MNTIEKLKNNYLRLRSRVKEWNLMGINITLLPSALFNLVYILSNIFSGLAYRSLWALFITLAHLLLLLIRLYIFRAAHKDDDSLYYKRQRARSVGRMLLLLDIPALMSCVYAVIFETAKEYGKGIIIIFAAYAVYSLIASLVGIVRSFKVRSPLLFASRNLTLTTALFSLFNLGFSVVCSLDLSIALRRIILTLGTGAFAAAVLISAFSLIMSPLGIRESNSQAL